MRGVSNHDAAGSAGQASINAMAASYLQRTAEEEQKHRKALKDKEEGMDRGAITRPLIDNSFRAVRALMEAGGGQQARSAGAAHDVRAAAEGRSLLHLRECGASGARMPIPRYQLRKIEGEQEGER